MAFERDNQSRVYDHWMRKHLAGANVLFEKDRGVVVPWDETLRIIEVRYILAIVDIITEDEIQ